MHDFSVQISKFHAIPSKPKLAQQPHHPSHANGVVIENRTFCTYIDISFNSL